MARTGAVMRFCRCSCKASAPSMGAWRMSKAQTRSFATTPRRRDQDDDDGNGAELDPELWTQAKGSIHRYLLLSLKGDELAAYKAQPLTSSQDRQAGIDLKRGDRAFEDFEFEK